MPDIDVALAHHCLEDLGGRNCPIVKERSAAMRPEVCDGLSIRDTLFSFLVQAEAELWQHKARPGKKSKKRMARLRGQVDALAYAVALIDNPYRVTPAAAVAAARMEIENSTI